MTTSKAVLDELLPGSEAATYIHVSHNTLATYRSLGLGPAFLKFGNRVFYRRGDLDDWITSRRVRSTAEARNLKSHARPRRARETTARRQQDEGGVISERRKREPRDW